MIQRLEEERLADAQHPGIQQDETLQRLVHEDGARLMQGVRLLGQAALLLLKKQEAEPLVAAVAIGAV